jgi:hypothetical protein
MKKANLGFPKITEANFYTLSNSQAYMVRGGDTRTGGGSKQDGIPYKVTLDGKDYRCTPMRCWDSDTVDANGVTCYTNETSTNVYTPYWPD